VDTVIITNPKLGKMVNNLWCTTLKRPLGSTGDWLQDITCSFA
jgi:hypothetical protein